MIKKLISAIPDRSELHESGSYKRWRVYSTFFTGFMIGLFYVVLISANLENDLPFINQRILVLMFTGIMGGVIYSILVDDHIEIPRFRGNNGDRFYAGLFGDILLGLAGAVVLAFLGKSLNIFPEDDDGTYIVVAAIGIIGGYGGRAILEFALKRVFADVNLLEEDRQQYLSTSFQQNIEVKNGLEIIDHLNEHITTGLSSTELTELTQDIRQSSTSVRKQVFNLTKEFRSTANLSDVSQDLIQRTIPIFETLIETDPEHYQYYAQLAYAYKESAIPNLFKAIQYLDKAIEIRGDNNLSETWKYELSRALIRIDQNYLANNSYTFNQSINQKIIADLLVVSNIYNIKNIVQDAKAKRISISLKDWIDSNRKYLESQKHINILIIQLEAILFSEEINHDSINDSLRQYDLDGVLNKSTNSVRSEIISQSDNNLIPRSAIELIKEFEGYHKKLPDGRAVAYPDPNPENGWDVATIGYGTTIYPDGRKVQKGDIITRREAEEFLIWEVTQKCKAALEKIPTWNQMNDNQRAALFSFAYNLGAYFYKGSNFSSITKVCDSPSKWSNKDWIEEQFVKYRNPGTEVEIGLRRRRVKEANLFCQPVTSMQGSIVVRPLYKFLSAGEKLDIDFVADNKPLATHIQEVLIWLDLLEPPADGNFGPISAEALLTFQKIMMKKIPALANEEGLLGPLTTKALIETSPDDFPKPQLTLENDLASRIIKYMKEEGYQIFTKPREYNIVYIEGMNIDGTLNNDTPNHFNDVRMVIEFKNEKPEIIDRWEATTEPGYYYTNNPMNPKGAARIKFGQYKAWRNGLHNNNHSALIQVGGSVSVHRDFDRNMERTGDKVDTGYFGINQHWGYDAAVNNIYTASAGCLVGRTRQGHRKFMDLIKGDQRYQTNNSYTFYSTIIPGDDLEERFPS